MDLLLASLQLALDPVSLAMLVGGVVVGLIVGALPGVGGVFALVLLLPLVDGYALNVVMGLVIGLGSVTTTSDTMPAVLIGVPGSAAAIATVEDGHPLARQGEADRALGAAYSASMLGGIFGAIFLALVIPVLRPFVLSLRTPDFLAVSVLGLLFVAIVSGKQPLKGVLSALLGLLLSMVGLDSVNAAERLTFGDTYLWDGLSFSIVFVGIFGIVELSDLLARGSVSEAPFRASAAGVWRGIKDTLREWRLVFASSVVGTFVGAIPGIGVTTIDWIAYGIARRDRKGGPEFGQGNIRGVIAPESANNAKEGGNLIPTLAIGLPGSIGMIFVLQVLATSGVAPGPKMLTDHLPLIYAIVIFIAVANILGTGLCLVLTRPIAALANAPATLLVPIVLAFIILAAFREHLMVQDFIVLAIAASIGLFMKRGGWPRPAFALGFVLGPSVERYFFLSSQLNGWTFLTRPAVVVVLLTAVVAGVWLIRTGRLTRRSFVFAATTWADRILLVLLGGLAVLTIVTTDNLLPAARLFPLIVSAAILLVMAPSLLQIGSRRPDATLVSDLVPILRIAGLIGFSAAAIYAFGPIIATIVFVTGASFALGHRRVVPILVAAALSSLAVYVLFFGLQHVSWPHPLIG